MCRAVIDEGKHFFEVLFKEHLGDSLAARASLPFPFTPVNEALDQAFSGAG